MQPISSAITGQPSQDRPQPSSTGTPHGEAGAVVTTQTQPNESHTTTADGAEQQRLLCRASLTKAFTKTAVLTTGGKLSAIDRQIWIESMVKLHECFPARTVGRALEMAMRSSKWLPTPAEIAENMEILDLREQQRLRPKSSQANAELPVIPPEEREIVRGRMARLAEYQRTRSVPGIGPVHHDDPRMKAWVYDG